MKPGILGNGFQFVQLFDAHHFKFFCTFVICFCFYHDDPLNVYKIVGCKADNFMRKGVRDLQFLLIPTSAQNICFCLDSGVNDISPVVNLRCQSNPLRHSVKHSHLRHIKIYVCVYV